MMEKYKTYSRYKDSEDERLSYIPQSWDRKKLKFLAKIKNGQDYKSIEVDTGYPVLGSGGQFTASSKYLYDRPSVLLGRKGTVDKPIYIDEPFWTVDTMYYTEIKNEIPEKFFYYLCLTIPFGKYITSTALPSMTQENLSNNIFYIPINYEEKQNIANFLDYETSKMDMLIEKQQQLIKLLEEKRQAVISHAVTKGLNPNVSMKDSGVEWLGEIPEYWEIYRLKTITTLKTSKSCFKNNLIALENIESWSGKYVKTENDYSGDGIAFKAGDILFGKLRPYLAKVYIAESDGEAIGDFFVLRTKPKVISRFLQLCLLTQEVIFIINGSTFGAKMPRVSWEFMGNLSFVIPPLKEQEEIISYLKAEISKLDLLIEKANQTIILLKERRTALISAAVTGKIDVRDWQAPTITV
ncbi:restriction endonuclease subunit S [Snodgrassella sp. ESL0323]|uniref:restriction endonuclease subunit S n=1 Tax=Snodgrassella sp. ESL0323 TaxID=2705034 RepID=UPI0019348408|nr:restriction endonuclease subunit S [Snodgrassella sp. ESL0323]